MWWLRFIPYGGIAVISAMLTWQVAGLYYGSAIARLEKAHDKTLSETLAGEREACAKNQKTTSEVSDAYQKKIREINARHADAVHRLLQHEAAKRLQPADAPGGHDAAAGGDGVYRPDSGVAFELLGLAATAERQAQQLTACQDYVGRLTR